MAIKEVQASVANVKESLEHQGGTLYTGEWTAPQRQLKTPEKKTYYPVVVTAKDDSGLIDTDSSQVLEVYRDRAHFRKNLSSPPRKGKNRDF